MKKQAFCNPTRFAHEHWDDACSAFIDLALSYEGDSWVARDVVLLNILTCRLGAFRIARIVFIIV